MRSDPIPCFTRNAIEKIKTHTTQIGFSGTDGDIYMTFKLLDKKTGETLHQCEQLKSALDNYGDDREYAKIDIYQIAHLSKNEIFFSRN